MPRSAQVAGERLAFMTSIIPDGYPLAPHADDQYRERFRLTVEHVP